MAAKIRAKRYRIVLEYLRNVEWAHFGKRNEVVFRRDNETVGTAKWRAIGWERLGVRVARDWLGMAGKAWE